MDTQVAVIGASGHTGPTIVAAILEMHGSCRVIGREPERLTSLYGSQPGIDIRGWDPERFESIRPALQGVGTVIYLVGVPYHRFDLHPLYMRRTLEAAIEAHVSRLLLVSPVYSYGSPQRPLVDERHPREPETRKGILRKMQEDIVLTAHASGKIEGAILRVSDFFGPHCSTSILNDAFVAARTGRAAMLIGPTNTPHQFAFVPDLGNIVARVAMEQKAYGRAWNFAGSGTTSQDILLREAFRQSGKRPRTRAIGKNALRLLGLFDPVMRELVEMSYMHTKPVLLSDEQLRGLIGPFHTTPYDDAVAQILAAM